VAVALAGPYADHLHLAPDRKTMAAPHHSVFLQARWSCNSVKVITTVKMFSSEKSVWPRKPEVFAN